jgi:hypothetical protein
MYGFSGQRVIYVVAPTTPLVNLNAHAARCPTRFSVARRSSFGSGILTIRRATDAPTRVAPRVSSQPSSACRGERRSSRNRAF